MSPNETHRRLKSRAAIAGRSPNEAPLAAIREVAERPSLDEMLARLSRTPVGPAEDPVAVIREVRDRQ